MGHKAALLLAFASALVLAGPQAVSHEPAIQSAIPAAERITILVDAFGEQPLLKRDWGFAALIDYGEKRILFDTGNFPTNFSANI